MSDPALPVLFEGSMLSLPRTGVAQYVANLAAGLCEMGTPASVLLQERDQSGSYLDDLVSRRVELRRASNVLYGAYLVSDRFGIAPRYECLAGPARCLVFANNRMFPTRLPSLATVHDLVHLVHPEFIDPEWRPRVTRRVTAVLERADLILADTHTMAQELTSVCGLDPLRVRVVPCAPATFPDPTHSGPGIPGAIIAVGTLERRKNLVRLVRAHQLLDEAVRAAHPLILVGGPGYGASEVAAALDDDPHARWHQNVSQRQLAGIFATASLLIQPSLYEGFGMPPVEALAHGLPVVVADTPVLREVTSGIADAYVDPLDVDDIARGMNEVLALDPEQIRRTRASYQMPYSWRSSAQILDAVIDEVAPH
jgi:alpha-1,3-rhamnosyl/mannosyltransferase